MRTPAEINRLAKEAGMHWSEHFDVFEDVSSETLGKLIEIVAREERIRCLEAVEKEAEHWDREYKEGALEASAVINNLG